MKRRFLLGALMMLAVLAPSAAVAYDRYPYAYTVCYDRWGNAYDCRYNRTYYGGAYYGPSFGYYGVWPSYGHHHHHDTWHSGHDYHGWGHGIGHHDYGSHGFGHHGFGHGGHHGGHGH